MAGTLYVVSTPIGNLEDLSPRARDVLARAAVLACEDTRVTGKLLRRFGIRTPSVSYHEHNELERASELLTRLEEGKDVALVSDAGTPLVSDPGYRLVRAAREAGVAVRAVPGPSAVLAALSVSGLPTSRFTFVGFLPPKGKARESAVEALATFDHTVVLFESGTRIARLLSELSMALGPREATVLREMTKLHEEHRSGSLPDLAAWASSRAFKGELTLVVGGRTPDSPRATSICSLAPRFQE
ncbi:MAG: 16S rRNA (cytidine(1402)-2'-O)-methyltransferase, partial [Vicinamibacteria bacterium]